MVIPRLPSEVAPREDWLSDLRQSGNMRWAPLTTLPRLRFRGFECQPPVTPNGLSENFGMRFDGVIHVNVNQTG
jgi:hypothetical protein